MPTGYALVAPCATPSAAANFKLRHYLAPIRTKRQHATSARRVRSANLPDGPAQDGRGAAGAWTRMTSQTYRTIFVGALQAASPAGRRRTGRCGVVAGRTGDFLKPSLTCPTSFFGSLWSFRPRRSGGFRRLAGLMLSKARTGRRAAG
jgi:hypothetical protein